MKKLALTSASVMALALGAFGQGAVFVDNSTSTGSLSQTAQGNYYTGTANIEVWYLNSTAASDANINSLNGSSALVGGVSANVAAYNFLTADGFTLATQILGVSVGDGVISIPTALEIAGITLANGGALFGIAAWTQGSSFTSTPGGFGGVLTFFNPTSNYTVPPPGTPVPPALNNWNPDLVMTPITVPEPGISALAGLGAAAMMIFRRRK